MRGCPGYRPLGWLTDFLTRAFQHAMTGIKKQAWRTDRDWDHKQDWDFVVLMDPLWSWRKATCSQGKAGIHTSCRSETSCNCLVSLDKGEKHQECNQLDSPNGGHQPAWLGVQKVQENWQLHERWAHLLPQEHLEIATTSYISNLRGGVLGIVFN